MLGVFYGAGLRRGEVAGLDVTDYDADERSLIIRHAKRGKQRIVYLTATAARRCSTSGSKSDATNPPRSPSPST